MSARDLSSAAPLRLTSTQWLICVIAAIGFAFDIYELLMLPLVLGPALKELGGITPAHKDWVFWSTAMFYVPAFCGGIFGLLGGYLTDRLGRRRVLTWSILLYAFSAFAAGFSTNIGMLLFFRTTTFIGVCVEFVAAVAWLAELFDNPTQREKVLGYTQAFSSIGGLLVAFASGLIVQFATHLPQIGLPEFLLTFFGGKIGDPHAAWRYTLMSGIVPAIPLIVIRPFLPESPKWAAKKEAGTLRRASISQLFSPELRTTTLVTTAMFACSYGVAFGAIQQMPLMVAGIEVIKTEIAAKASAAKEIELEKEPDKEKAVEKAKMAAGRVAGEVRLKKAAEYTKAQEVGGLVGRFGLAALVVYFASRRTLLRVFLIPGMILTPFVFIGFARGQESTFFSADISWIPGFHGFHISLLGIGIFIAGLFTVAQFSFWGNYLPHAYPVHLRGTGESFAANIGGRMIGTMFFGVTQFVAAQPIFPASVTSPESKIAYVAAAVAGILFAMNLILSCFLPEPKLEEA